MIRVLHIAAPKRMTGQEAPGMSGSVVVSSLRLHDGTVPRTQGELCGQHVMAASGISLFVGSRLSMLRRTYWDERRLSRQHRG